VTIEHFADGTRRATTREWVPEAAVALEFNGLAYADRGRNVEVLVVKKR